VTAHGSDEADQTQHGQKRVPQVAEVTSRGALRSTRPHKSNHNQRRRRAGLRAALHAYLEISMSLSAIDAMLRERRLAAMRAEIEESLDGPPPEGQTGRGYDPNELLLGGQPDADPWTSTRAVPGTELAGPESPYGFPKSAPTMNVAMRGWPTGVWPGPGLPAPFPPDVWEPWRRHSEQGIKGLIDAWRSLFKGSPRGSSKGPEDECDAQYAEDSAICRAARSRTCWEQAALRLANCTRGLPIPPLGFGGR
jgi:hypothetical protein